MKDTCVHAEKEKRGGGACRPAQPRQLWKILEQGGKWEHQPTLLKYKGLKTCFNNSNSQVLKATANLSTRVRYSNLSSALSSWLV